jgi:hypothetical protein
VTTLFALDAVFLSVSLCQFFLSFWLSPRIVTLGVSAMDYEVDFDPAHSVIRLTVTAEVVTLELAEEVYQHLSDVTSRGGPYAAIYDLSAAKRTTIPTDMVRSFARRRPSIPIGRTHVVVGKEPVIYGLARVFQMCSEFLGSEFQVVWSLEEAYDIVGARPEDFTECLIWPNESTQPQRA